MKRLIIVLMIAMSVLVQAEEGVVPSTQPAVIQSSSDANLKNSDNSSVMVTNIHQISLDTIEVDGGGNWLNKRIWYERSQAIFDEIRAMVSAVADLRIQFSNEVNNVGRKIDLFWEDVDFTKGELEEKFKEILLTLDTEQKMVGDLSVEERNLQVTIKQEQATIDQIGKDIKSIHDVDDKIDQTLVQAFKTIDECRDYESKAWDDFKAIGKELDDKKARNIYYQMNNYKQNIDQKSNYLKSTLLPYLHNVLVAKIESNIGKITDAMTTLKNKGIDVAKIMSKNQDDDIIQLHARQKEATEIAIKKTLEEDEIKAKEVAAIAAKALEEEKQKSFSNVMHQYYEATIGRVVHFVYQGYAAVSIDYLGKMLTLHIYPVVIYVYNMMLSIKMYMHNSVESIMIYFYNGKPNIKAEIIEKNNEQKNVVTPQVTKVITSTTGLSHATSSEDHEAMNSDKVAGGEAALTASSLDSVQPNAVVSSQADDASITEITQAVASVSSASPASVDTKVTIQSMRNDDRSQGSSNNLYHVFTTILDLIRTICISIYNCILHFLKLLLSLSLYVTSSN